MQHPDAEPPALAVVSVAVVAVVLPVVPVAVAGAAGGGTEPPDTVERRQRMMGQRQQRRRFRIRHGVSLLSRPQRRHRDTKTLYFVKTNLRRPVREEVDEDAVLVVSQTGSRLRSFEPLSLPCSLLGPLVEICCRPLPCLGVTSEETILMVSNRDYFHFQVIPSILPS